MKICKYTAHLNPLLNIWYSIIVILFIIILQKCTIEFRNLWSEAPKHLKKKNIVFYPVPPQKKKKKKKKKRLWSQTKIHKTILDNVPQQKFKT